jgi:hypothetical protein
MKLVLMLLVLSLSACVRPVIVCDTPGGGDGKVIVAQEFAL